MNLSDVALWCVLGIICVGGVKVIGFEAAPPWLYNDSTLIYWNETLGNLTYLNASPNSFVVNEDADGQTDKLILRGHGGAAAARRSGQIAWEFDAAGNEVGHMFVSSQNELVFCNESQSSATDDCFDTYIDFDDGSLTVQGSPPLLGHQNWSVIDEHFTTHDIQGGTGEMLFLHRPDQTMDKTYTVGSTALADWGAIAVWCSDPSVDRTDRDCVKITSDEDLWMPDGGIFLYSAGPMGAAGGGKTIEDLFRNYYVANLGGGGSYPLISTVHVNSQRYGDASDVQAFSIKATDSVLTGDSATKFTAVDMYFTANNAGGASEHTSYYGGGNFYFSGGNTVSKNYTQLYGVYGGGYRNKVALGGDEVGAFRAKAYVNSAESPFGHVSGLYVEDFSNWSASSYGVYLEAGSDTPSSTAQTFASAGTEYNEGGLILGNNKAFAAGNSFRIKTGGMPSSETDFDLSINSSTVNITTDLQVAGETHLFGDVYHYTNCFDDNATSCYADIAERMHTKETEQETSCTAAWEEELIYYEEELTYKEVTRTVCTDLQDPENETNIHYFEQNCRNETIQVVNGVQHTEKTKTIHHPSSCSFTGEYIAPNGMPVCADPDHPRMIQQCDNAFDTKVLGVISYNATQILGQAGYPVAMVGNVPVRVRCENIEPGDLLCTDSNTLRAIKCDPEWAPTWQLGLKYTAAVFAKALEPCTTGGTEIIRGWI